MGSSSQIRHFLIDLIIPSHPVAIAFVSVSTKVYPSDCILIDNLVLNVPQRFLCVPALSDDLVPHAFDHSTLAPDTTNRLSMGTLLEG